MTTYQDLLKDVKIRIRQAQLKAVMSANAEMLMLYWDIGRMIHLRQSSEGWGSRIIPRLAKDIRNEISEVKGFSERNLDRMLAFYREYKRLAISPPPVAELARNGNAVSNSLEYDRYVPIAEKILKKHLLLDRLSKKLKVFYNV